MLLFFPSTLLEIIKVPNILNFLNVLKQMRSHSNSADIPGQMTTVAPMAYEGYTPTGSYSANCQENVFEEVSPPEAAVAPITYVVRQDPVYNHQLDVSSSRHLLFRRVTFLSFYAAISLKYHFNIYFFFFEYFWNIFESFILHKISVP